MSRSAEDRVDVVTDGAPTDGVTTDHATTDWGSLVTTALLGTDRRQPPPPPAGPVGELLGDLSLVLGDDTPDAQLLDHVAVLTVARRAAARPWRAVDPLAPPPADDRPLCPLRAVAMWRRIVAEWPVLEDEWLALARWQRVALPGDLLVDLLTRHRRDDVRTTLVAAVAGPVVDWLAEHVPAIAGHVPQISSRTEREMPVEAVDLRRLPALPIPAELQPLLVADPSTFAGSLASGIETGVFDSTHRRVLTHVVARCQTAVLDEAAMVLGQLADINAIAASLADLVDCRRDLLVSFEPTAR